MNATDLILAHFDAIADAPGGGARLRQLILQLAVQGRLVPQDPSDEPGSALLERIRVLKDCAQGCRPVTFLFPLLEIRAWLV